LILTAGVGAGLAIGMPRPFLGGDADSWRSLLTAVLVGISLAGPLFALCDRRRRLGWGGLFWFAQGLGVLLLLPPMLMERFGADRIRLSPTSCLAYVLPLMGLWFTLAAMAGGLVHRRRLRRAAWRDRFGVLLAAAWSPLGIWIVADFYRDAFFR
jgi:4-amino-4-deoxy-L-arabinose transferase-like glycosyltransferase